MDRRIPFTKEDEEKIASAGLWGIIVAIASIASAALGLLIVMIVGGGKNLVTQFITVGVTTLLGVWLYQASVAFRKVALTDIADQQYLMEGFQKLRAYFMTIGILVIIGLSLFALVFLGAMMCGGIGGSMRGF